MPRRTRTVAKRTSSKRGTRQPSDWTVKGKAHWRSTAQLLWRAWPLRKQVLEEGRFKIGRKWWNTCEECGQSFPMTEKKTAEVKSGRNKGKKKTKNVSNFQVDHKESSGSFYLMQEAVDWLVRLLVLKREDLQRLCVDCHKSKTKEERQEAKEDRAATAYSLYTEEGLSVPDIAELLQLKETTIRMYIKSIGGPDAL